MNYPTWPPPNASPLHAIEPWGRQLFVFTPYAADLSASPSGPYPRWPPLRGPAPPMNRLSPNLERLSAAAAAAAERAAAAAAAAGVLGVLSEDAYEAATEAKKAAAAAATAAAAEVAAGPLLPAANPILCVADHGRRPLMFLSAADLFFIKKNIQRFKTLIEEFRLTAKASNIEKIYRQRRLLLPYKTVGMQRMKKGEHQSYGMKKGVAREKKT
ncbi:Conserved Plasmodium protein, related [Eimeria mitis]|uniref:Conserved Plasmodium protein, related n=1 Tax=Eimeria mitis TaxID=44415 RepID=U6JVI1_9EIME|nr:Conserved Plasmodium protein, related [Eimeria mitis]CDJ28786.1 Conserved Plasmodium protein, related [Eimeria mitis]